MLHFFPRTFLNWEMCRPLLKKKEKSFFYILISVSISAAVHCTLPLTSSVIPMNPSRIWESGTQAKTLSVNVRQVYQSVPGVGLVRHLSLKFCTSVEHSGCVWLTSTGTPSLLLPVSTLINLYEDLYSHLCHCIIVLLLLCNLSIL